MLFSSGVTGAQQSQSRRPGSPQAGCWPHSRASVTRKWESRDDSGGKREAPHGPQDRAEVSVFSGRGRPSAWPHATVTSISATSPTSERRHRHHLGRQKSRYRDPWASQPFSLCLYKKKINHGKMAHPVEEVPLPKQMYASRQLPRCESLRIRLCCKASSFAVSTASNGVLEHAGLCFHCVRTWP